MAERRGSTSSNNSKSKSLTVRDAVQCVRDEFPDLLGRPIEAILGIQGGDEDDWTVTVQVLELARIPNSTDVLGAYAVTLGRDGEMTGYRRLRRYNRGQADED